MYVVTDMRMEDMMSSIVLSDHSAPFLASAAVAAVGTFCSLTLFCIRSSASLYAATKSLAFCVTSALSTPGGETSTENEPVPLSVISTPRIAPDEPFSSEIVFDEDV